MRHPISTSYITPIKSDGTVQTESATEFGRGSYTLASSSTYYFPLGGQDVPFLSGHMQWDASIILTSVTIEDCNFPETDVTWYSNGSGEWIDEDPTTAFVGLDGAGATASNGVVAVAGGAQGGAMFHVAQTGARRTRLAVVVAGTGGEVRVSGWGKE